MGNAHRNLIENLNRRSNSEDRDIDGRIILKWGLNPFTPKIFAYLPLALRSFSPYSLFTILFCFAFLALLNSIFSLISVSSSIRRLLLLLFIFFPSSFFLFLHYITFNLLLLLCGILNNAGSRATGYGFERLRVWSSSSDRGMILLLSMFSRPMLWPTQTPIQWVLGSFPRG